MATPCLVKRLLIRPHVNPLLAEDRLSLTAPHGHDGAPPVTAHESDDEQDRKQAYGPFHADE